MPKTPIKTVVPRGRKPGQKPETRSTEESTPAIMMRAKALYLESGRKMKPAEISKILRSEGHGYFPSNRISTWKSRFGWDDNGALAAMTQLQRDALPSQPGDMQRVEDASNALAAVSAELAQCIAKQIPTLKIKSASDLEIATRCATDLVKTHLIISRGLHDLRLARVTRNFDDEPKNGAKNGEIIPPAPSGGMDLDRAVEQFA